MARPTVIRDADILDAARAVFLERGALATSAEVAQRAGISEGSIFKRFRTKAELFRAAMGLRFGDMPAAFAELPLRAGQGTVEENLTQALLGAIEQARLTFPIIAMSLANPKLAIGIPDALDVPDPPPLVAQRVLSAYLEAEIRLGRVRPIDTAVLARGFFGAIVGHVLSEALVGRVGGAPIDAEHYVSTYVRSMLTGLAAPPRAREAAPVPRARPGAAMRPSTARLGPTDG